MKVDPELFLIQERDGLRLITPKKSTALADSTWTPETIHYRSRIETLDGETVSQGFKKFMNLGQGPDELRVTAADVIEACLRDDAVATVKLDGSLIVRSVYQGQVLLRTRGSFGYDYQANAHEVEEFGRRYPRLLDPTYMADCSLLLEWMSPTNIIILKHLQAELILVSGIRHNDLRYLRLMELQEVAAYLGLPLVEYFRLDQHGWTELCAALATDSEREGYVVRINDEQALVKVKCAPYLAKHAFKYGMSASKIVDLWLQAGRPSEKDFVDSLIHQFDEETIMWALPFITDFFRCVRAVEEREARVRHAVEQHRALSRKDFALLMQRQFASRDFSLAMLLLDGKSIPDRLLRHLLEEQFAASGATVPAAAET